MNLGAQNGKCRVATLLSISLNFSWLNFPSSYSYIYEPHRSISTDKKVPFSNSYDYTCR